MDNFPMTSGGYQALQEEVKHLKKTVRPEIIKHIAEARSHGDLSENAEYDAARERQSFVEGRIRDLEARLARAQVIDVSKLSGDKVLFGATVTLYDCEAKAPCTWTIVGETEADLKKNKISNTSPLAKALLGKGEGEPIQLKTPKGSREYEIIKVEFIAV